MGASASVARADDSTTIVIYNINNGRIVANGNRAQYNIDPVSFFSPVCVGIIK